ncbi:MAG TPA: hypothetical protein VF257_14995 [Solirubrobacteraceae bacterium]
MIPLETGMGYTEQTVAAAASIPAVAFFELKPTLDVALAAGAVPLSVTRGVLRDNEGRSQSLKLIAFSPYAAFFAVPVGPDVDKVTVIVQGPSGTTMEASKKSSRRRARLLARRQR